MTGIILLVLMAAAPMVMMSGGDDAEDMDMDMDGDNVEETMPPDTNISNDLVGGEDDASDEEDRPVGPVHLADINGGSEDDAEQDVNPDTNTGDEGDPEPEEDPQPEPEPEPEPEPDGNEEDPNPVVTNEERLTALSETYNGDLFTRHVVHLDGGNDIASGGAYGDIFEGGEGRDIISGRGGDDVLFATDREAGSASDGQSDRLDGGTGDDTLVFGDQDVATGGEGSDTFKIQHDTLLYTVITDFDATADMILIESEDPDNLDVAFQMRTQDGYIVTLTNGAVVLLEGVTQEVGSDRLAIVGIQPTI